MNDAIHSALKTHFGYSEFRPGQQQAIQQLLNGYSSLAIFPTGSGKSLCYQLTALQLPNLTLVVSPLLALMKDQLGFLAAKGIAAASLDSTLDAQQYQKVMADVRAGNIKILMVSVERFKNERFRQFIESVAISMLVVDEAHCISEWGHNFRPDYLKLPDYRKQLNIPLVLLLTATATRKVKRDMAEKFAIDPAHIVQTGFYRSNLDLSVKAVSADEKDRALVELIRQQSGAGIVYVTLQNSAERLAAHLLAQGISAVAYHAGFDSSLRQQIQDDYMVGRMDVVVATIAFGMGIDKADIRYVIHYDLPKSIENYSQEIGRAGRDGALSYCITLANLDGLNTVENFVYGDTPEQPAIEAVLDDIRQQSGEGTWELQIVSLSNACNVRQLPLKTLLVQLELRGVLKPLYSYFANFRYKFLVDQQAVLQRFQGERFDFLSQVFANSAFKRIWGSPDFDALFQLHGFPRERVVAALEYLQEQQLIELEAKKITEVFAVKSQTLADEKLAEQLYRYFVEKEQSEIKRIATLVRFFELDRCLSSNLSGYFDDNQVPEKCGHCSVCRGQVAKLRYSSVVDMPDSAQMLQWLSELRDHLQSKLRKPLSLDTCSRFLAGLSTPMFSRYKVRQLTGFGRCEQIGYQQIRDAIQPLLNQL